MINNNSKSGWKSVAFGEVVKQIKDRVDRDWVGLKYYLGGEHFSNGELHVNGKGVINENPIGPAFHMRFKPGHMLLVSRNPHLRKASIAEFEGICANTTYVCEARSNYLLPELLPFIMQSDEFWISAEANKRGSTNPYLNWSDFARFEFLLPSLTEQKRITKILWAADNADSKYIKAQGSLIRLLKVDASKLFPDPNKQRGLFVPFKTICHKKPQSGLYKGPDYLGSGIKTVNMRELFAHDVIDENIPMQRTKLTPKELDRYSLTSNDLLFGRRSIVLEGAGKCSMVGSLDEPVIFESSILRVTVDSSRAKSDFLFEWFNSPAGLREIMKIRSFTTIAGITGTDLNKVRIPLLPLETQSTIIERINHYRARLKLMKRAHLNISGLKKVLLNKLTGGHFDV